MNSFWVLLPLALTPSLPLLPPNEKGRNVFAHCWEEKEYVFDRLFVWGSCVLASSGQPKGEIQLGVLVFKILITSHFPNFCHCFIAREWFKFVHSVTAKLIGENI
jgi:hypothetical protein